MASTVFCEACLPIHLRVKLLSVSGDRCRRDGSPALESSCTVPPHKSVELFIFCFGSVSQNSPVHIGHQQVGLERTYASSLVPSQPFQQGRNQLRPLQRSPRAFSDTLASFADEAKEGSLLAPHRLYQKYPWQRGNAALRQLGPSRIVSASYRFPCPLFAFWPEQTLKIQVLVSLSFLLGYVDGKCFDCLSSFSSCCSSKRQRISI